MTMRRGSLPSRSLYAKRLAHVQRRWRMVSIRCPASSRVTRDDRDPATGIGEVPSAITVGHAPAVRAERRLARRGHDGGSCGYVGGSGLLRTRYQIRYRVGKRNVHGNPKECCKNAAPLANSAARVLHSTVLQKMTNLPKEDDPPQWPPLLLYRIWPENLACACFNEY